MRLVWLKTKNIKHWRQCIVLTAFLLLISRKSDILLNAQFWAEDGAYWFREAYTQGWVTLFKPHTGYLQTISRVVALTAQFVPLVWAPLVFNLAAIGIRLLVVGWLFSPRFLPGLSKWWRGLAALIYIGLPNSTEVLANLTNAHWHLALLAFMIAWSRPPERWQKWTDMVLFLLMGLSGPFILIIAPLTLWHWYKQKGLSARRMCAIVLTTALLIQLCVIVFTSSDQRTSMELGASGPLLGKIITGQIILGSIVGEPGYAMAWRHGLFAGLLGTMVWSLAMIVLIGITTTAFRRGPNILRYGLIAAGALFAASLLSPMASTTQAQWTAMLPPGAAGRYWFIPSLAFVAMICWWLQSGVQKWRRFFGIVFATVVLVGIVWNWRLNPWPQTNFVEHARNFEKSASGTVHTFTLMPANWGMTLIKK